EGTACRSFAIANGSTSIALTNRFGEKLIIPDASSCDHATVEPREEISSHSSREDEKQSPRSAEARCDRGENPERFPDLDDQRRAVQASADSLSPSPSTALCRQAARKPPDKTTVKSSSLHRSESGPDSTNWRARGLPSASSLREVNILEAGLRSKGVGKCEHASKVFGLEQDSVKSLHASGDKKGSPQDAKSDPNIANLRHSRLEVSAEAPAQDYLHVYTGGQVLTSSRRDGRPKSSRSAGNSLPQNAKSDTASTVPDGSVRAHATVEPCAKISSHSPCDTPERSPPSTECDGNDELPPKETTSNGSSLRVSRSISLSHFATVPSAAPLPSSPSSATPRILGDRRPPDKTPDRSSTNSCQPAQRRWPASILSAGPPRWSSRRLRYAGGPDTAGWRQISVPSRNDVSSCGSRARRWYSPRFDAADTAAPSTSRRHFHAFKRGHVLKPLENGASDLKRVHAGGQTVLSSCKDVKPLDAREAKKHPPWFIASDSEGQRSPSPKLNLATSSTCGRKDFALRCNSLPHSAREVEIIEQPYESGSGAEDKVSLINGRGDNPPANTARDCGHGTHARDSEVVTVFPVVGARASPD
ncbi:hypothetical protein EV121DRAFT_172405, partial [Schizophyllum commune]